MVRSRLVYAVLLAAMALLDWSGPRGAAQTTGGTQSTPAPAALPSGTVLRTNTSLVLVDVVVADKNKPIHALDRARFHVFEDGHEQTVVSFDEHANSEPAAAALHPVKPAPGIYSNVPAYPDTGVVNVLLLDSLNTPIADQMQVRHLMLEYLEKIRPGTTLAVYTLASRLRLVQGFTTDAAQLGKALKGTEAGVQESAVLQTESEAASNDQLIDTMTVGGASPTAIASMRQFLADTSAFQTDLRVSMTITALNELARSLSGISGRKNLIWFSGSFPISVDPDDALKSPFQAMRNYADDVQQTAQLLSAARVAVYPVDARGLMTLPTFQASYQTSGNRAKGGNFNRDNNRFSQQTNNEQSTMQQIAEQTGGQAYLNTNGLAEAVADAVEHGSDYYTVGYVPDADKLDGHFHKIQVKVDGVGYRLAYRRGYYADTSGKATNHDPGKPSIIAQAAMHGAPLATQILFEAKVTRADDPRFKDVKQPSGPAGALATSLKGPVSRYFTEIWIDPKGIRFEDTAEGKQTASVELALIAYDADGKQLNYVDRAFTLSLSGAQYARVMAGRIPALMPLDLPAGKVELRLVVVDRAAGRAGSLEVPLTVAAAKAGS